MPIEIKQSFAAANGAHGEDENDEVDPVAHAKLVDRINNLTGSHYVGEVTRTEPTLNRTEFGLAKTQTDKIHLNDLNKFFKKTQKHTKVVKQLEKLKHKHPLEKPLEKPIAAKLKREEGFKRVKEELNQWQPVVKATEVAAQTVFPLSYEEVQVHNEPPKKLSEYRVKSELMEAMEKLEQEYAGSEDDGDDTDEEGRHYELTAWEMRQKQLERAKQKRLELFRIAKLRRQNKIKSKKYHRLLKKEKLKEQMKKFEELKEKDPEEAMRQLDLIERQRFEERATLRHKNTGTWSKNLQVRAKYDMEVRRELAEQLAIGRELTSKRLKAGESSSDSEGELELVTGRSGANPWVEPIKGGYEQSAADQRKQASNYRKYWEERNRVELLKKQLAEQEKHANGDRTNGEKVTKPIEDDEMEAEEIEHTKPAKKKKKGGEKESETVRMASGSWDVEEVKGQDEVPRKKAAAVKTKVKQKKKKAVKEQNATATVEELFQEAEELIQDAMEDKLDLVREKLKAKEEAAIAKQRKDKKKIREKGKSDPNDLSFKKKARLADADVEMNETIDKDARSSEQSNVIAAAALEQNTKSTAAAAEINTKKVVQMKPKHLLTALPDAITAGELSDGEPDEDENDKQRLTIAEAFEDDDIVADFAQDKRDERQKHLPQEVDLTLPGWGRWAGPGVQPAKPRSETRTLLKQPAELPRRDDNRDKVIINEDGLVNKQLSKHLVNQVPFPYVTVKDYEASLRAPVGRTFIPETAHVTMIEPRIVTKQGAVIEPMKKEMLMADTNQILRPKNGKLKGEAVEKYNAFASKVVNKSKRTV